MYLFFDNPKRWKLYSLYEKGVGGESSLNMEKETEKSIRNPL